MFRFSYGPDHSYDERCVCPNCMHERQCKRRAEEFGIGMTTIGGIFPYVMEFGAATIGEVSASADREQVIRDLIASALAKEDYETAAKLRDQLRP